MVALSLPLIPSNLVRGPQRRWGESEKLGECFYTVCEYEGVNLGLEERKKELSCLLPQGMSGRDPGQKELSGMQRCARAPSHTLTRGRAWASLVSTFSWLAYSVHLPRLAVVKKKTQLIMKIVTQVVPDFTCSFSQEQLATICGQETTERILEQRVRLKHPLYHRDQDRLN